MFQSSLRFILFILFKFIKSLNKRNEIYLYQEVNIDNYCKIHLSLCSLNSVLSRILRYNLRYAPIVNQLIDTALIVFIFQRSLIILKSKFWSNKPHCTSHVGHWIVIFIQIPPNPRNLWLIDYMILKILIHIVHTEKCFVNTTKYCYTNKKICLIEWPQNSFVTVARPNLLHEYC